MVINPAFLSLPGILSPNTSVLHQHILYNIQKRQIQKNLSRSCSITESPHNPNPPDIIFLFVPLATKIIIAIFLNTTDSQNQNTGPLAHNTDSFNMENGYDIATADDRSEILTWLSPLEPHLRHHEIQTNRVKDVGDWFLRTGEFRSWRNGDGRGGSRRAVIFCSGKLGVGKTYIR